MGLAGRATLSIYRRIFFIVGLAEVVYIVASDEGNINYMVGVRIICFFFVLGIVYFLNRFICFCKILFGLLGVSYFE